MWENTLSIQTRKAIEQEITEQHKNHSAQTDNQSQNWTVNNSSNQVLPRANTDNKYTHTHTTRRFNHWWLNTKERIAVCREILPQALDANKYCFLTHIGSVCQRRLQYYVPISCLFRGSHRSLHVLALEILTHWCIAEPCGTIYCEVNFVVKVR